MGRTRDKSSHLLILISVILLVLSVVNIRGISHEIRSNSMEKLELQARGIEDDVSRWAADNLEILYFFRDRVGYMTYEELYYTPFLNRHVQVDYQRLKIDALYIGFDNGTFITGREWIPEPSYDPRVRPWYVGAVTVGGAFIGDAYMDADTKKIICTFSLPVRTKDGVNGVVAIDLYMVTVTELMDRLVKGTDFGVALIDGKGTIIHYTGDNYLAGKKADDYPNSKVSVLYNQFLESAEKGSLSKARMTQDGIVLFDRLESSTWSTGVFTNDNAILTVADSGIRYQYGIYFIMMFMAGLAVLIVVKRDGQFNDMKVNLADSMNGSELSKHSAVLESVMDPLTRSFNRRYFDEQLERYWNLSFNNQESIGLILINIDQFKSFNDRYGRQKGDEVLIQILDELNRHLDPKFILSRFEGSTFAILGLKSESDELSVLGEVLRDGVEQLRIHHAGVQIGTLTTSLGIATEIPSGKSSMGSFVFEAQHALHSAKVKGGNRCECGK